MRLIFLFNTISWRFIITCFLVGFSNASGQGFNTAASWNLIEYGNRISALGQSSSALNNRIAFHPNPAIPAETGIVTFSSYLISSKPVQVLADDRPVMYNPAISYRIGKWSFSGKLDYTRFGFDIELRDEANNLLGERRASHDTRIIRMNVSRELFNKLYFGLGVSHIKDHIPILGRSQLHMFYDRAASGFMFSAGLYYHDSFPITWILLRPQVGLALTDIGGVLSYDVDSQSVEPQLMSFNSQYTTPGQLHSNFGLDIVTQKIVANQRFAQVGFYLGLNKYMSGLMKPGEGEVFYTGLEMVTGTWGSFERAAGRETTTFTLSDQLSNSFGIEFGLLETLFFQFGKISGADMWIRPQSTYGVILNQRYVSLSYNYIKYRQSNYWVFDKWSTSVWNIDIRVPIDGGLRPTFLDSIIEWLSE